MSRASDILVIHNLINDFDSNIQFTVDKFDNEIPHFFDIEIAPDDLSIFR